MVAPWVLQWEQSGRKAWALFSSSLSLADAKLLDFSSGVLASALFGADGAILPELLPDVRDTKA